MADAVAHCCLILFLFLSKFGYVGCLLYKNYTGSYSHANFCSEESCERWGSYELRTNKQSVTFHVFPRKYVIVISETSCIFEDKLAHRECLLACKVRSRQET